MTRRNLRRGDGEAAEGIPVRARRPGPGRGVADPPGREIARSTGCRSPVGSACPKITVYRSLRRLTELGLVDRWWEDQDIATASGRPRRRLYAVNEHGRDALPHGARGRAGARAAVAQGLQQCHPARSSTLRARGRIRPSKPTRSAVLGGEAHHLEVHGEHLLRVARIGRPVAVAHHVPRRGRALGEERVVAAAPRRPDRCRRSSATVGWRGSPPATSGRRSCAAAGSGRARRRGASGTPAHPGSCRRRRCRRSCCRARCRTSRSR